jgi:hypothetical protein
MMYINEYLDLKCRQCLKFAGRPDLVTLLDRYIFIFSYHGPSSRLTVPSHVNWSKK